MIVMGPLGSVQAYSGLEESPMTPTLSENH